MKLEDLYYEKPGYKPLVLTENWQLAQLNFDEAQSPENIVKLDRHILTDETFTLLKGRAILLIYDEEKEEEILHPMVMGHTYNVSAMTWHNIIMEQGSSVVITESRDAHIKGFSQIEIPEKLHHRIIRFSGKVWENKNGGMTKEKDVI